MGDKAVNQYQENRQRYVPNKKETLASQPLPKDQDLENLTIIKKQVKAMGDSLTKVSALISLSINYDKLNQKNTAKSLLLIALDTATNLPDINSKINALIQVANTYQELDQIAKAKEVLDITVTAVNSIGNQQLQKELLIILALNYGAIGEKMIAQGIFQQSQELARLGTNSQASYPFQELPLKMTIGVSGQVNSYTDTTANLGFTLDLYKQWQESDFWVDSNIYISFDSGRDINNWRPGGLATLNYRSHFNQDWNFFTNLLATTNDDLYSNSNNDEDIEVTATSLAGIGRNLWRGETPESFWDLQVGFGPRYEYRYINFDTVRNNVDPVLGVVLLGRGIEIGSAQLDEVFYIVPALNDIGNFIAGADTILTFPIGDNWAIANRLFIRYTNKVFAVDTPKVKILFSTGIEYSF